MRLFLAFAFATLGTAFLASDTLGCEDALHPDENPIIVLDNNAICKVKEHKEVIPGML